MGWGCASLPMLIGTQLCMWTQQKVNNSPCQIFPLCDLDLNIWFGETLRFPLDRPALPPLCPSCGQQPALDDIPEVGRSQNLIEIAYSKRGFASVFPERNDNIEPLGNSTVNTATSISDSDFKLEELFNLFFQNKGSKLFHFLRAPIPSLNVN